MVLRRILIANLVQQAIEAAIANDYHLANTTLTAVGILVHYDLPEQPVSDSLIEYVDWFHENFPKVIQHISDVLGDDN